MKQQHKPLKHWVESKLVVYSDGGCDPNPGIGGWGCIIIEKKNSHITKLSGGNPKTTNNAMEMKAGLEALRYIVNNYGRGTPVTIYSDSTYLVKGMNEWIVGWKKRGWTRRGKPLKNASIWKELDYYNQMLITNWQWIKGHSGNIWNDGCDNLATEAIAQIKKTS